MDRKQLLARVGELEAEVASLKAELADHSDCIKPGLVSYPTSGTSTYMPPAIDSFSVEGTYFPTFTTTNTLPSQWHISGSNWLGT
jgi:hypothetical protein